MLRFKQPFFMRSLYEMWDDGEAFVSEDPILVQLEAIGKAVLDAWAKLASKPLLVSRWRVESQEGRPPVLHFVAEGEVGKRIAIEAVAARLCKEAGWQFAGIAVSPLVPS